MIYSTWQLSECYLFDRSSRLFADKPWYSPVSRWNGGKLADILVKAGIATARTVSKKSGLPTSIICHSLPSQHEMEKLCLTEKKFKKLTKGVLYGSS